MVDLTSWQTLINGALVTLAGAAATYLTYRATRIKSEKDAQTTLEGKRIDAATAADAADLKTREELREGFKDQFATFKGMLDDLKTENKEIKVENKAIRAEAAELLRNHADCLEKSKEHEHQIASLTVAVNDCKDSHALADSRIVTLESAVRQLSNKVA